MADRLSDRHEAVSAEVHDSVAHRLWCLVVLDRVEP
jgi:hypothetical protein